MPLRRHKEIIEQIKILGYTDKKDLSDDEQKQLINSEYPVNRWIRAEEIDIKEITSFPTTVLYDNYVKWSLKHEQDKIIGKKQFFKFIEESFNVGKKQSRDGKRYFAIKRA